MTNHLTLLRCPECRLICDAAESRIAAVRGRLTDSGCPECGCEMEPYTPAWVKAKER